ncbi:MAG: hypothetical protein AYK18_17270 [Theionarchaea archaeon DG-70]|nr:MAG: hypothetical protein AYK18_17270 [Theionarchaea archaeon DG-70]
MTPDYAYMSIYTKDSELVKQVNEEVKRRGWSRNQFFCFLIEKAIAGQLVCITDKSLLEFAVMRAQELSLQNLDYYVSMLIKLDELGQVDHEGEINRDLLLEKLERNQN